MKCMNRTYTPEFAPEVLQRLDVYAARFRDDFNRPRQAQYSGVYLRGLILDGERKSIEPLSRKVTLPPGLVVADLDQALQQFVGQSTWDEQALWKRYRSVMAATFASPAGIFVIDDTSFPKQGQHSVGVQRQYCGAQGKKANCQVAPSVHYVSPRGHYPLAMKLYLPQVWLDDTRRLDRAGVPKQARGASTKGQIALELLDSVRAEGLPGRLVVDGVTSLVDEGTVVWQNTAGDSLPSRIYTTGGTVVATVVGVRGVDEAVEGSDAVTARPLAPGERLERGADGVIKLVTTAILIKGALPTGKKPPTAPSTGDGCFTAGTPVATTDDRRPTGDRGHRGGRPGLGLRHRRGAVARLPGDRDVPNPLRGGPNGRHGGRGDRRGDGPAPLLGRQGGGPGWPPPSGHGEAIPPGVATAGRWVDATHLLPGDELLLIDGRIAAIEAIGHRHLAGEVYNFAVEYLRSFAVGDAGFLVHNNPNCWKGKPRPTTPGTLPPKTLVKQDGVHVYHQTKSGEHAPPHVHIEGKGPRTKIGANVKKLKGYPELSSTQKSVVKENLSTIRRNINKIKSWFTFEKWGR